MVTEFRDRTGGTICNTHLLGSIPLNELLKNQNLQDLWKKIHLNQINYTYRRTLSNIHSRLDRIYSSQNLNVIDSKTLPSNTQITTPYLQSSSCGSELVVQDIGN